VGTADFLRRVSTCQEGGRIYIPAIAKPTVIVKKAAISVSIRDVGAGRHLQTMTHPQTITAGPPVLWEVEDERSGIL